MKTNLTEQQSILQIVQNLWNKNLLDVNDMIQSALSLSIKVASP